MTMVRLRPPLISLRCTYSGMPGFQWTATVRLRRVGDRYEVRQFAGEYRREDFLSTKLPAWRALAGFLAVQDDEWGITDQAMPEVRVTGARGWHADLLVLSWARFVDHDVRLGAIACAMPDKWLAAVARRDKGLVGGPDWFVDDLHLLNEHVDTAAKVAPQLKRLLASHDCASSRSPLFCLLRRLREQE